MMTNAEPSGLRLVRLINTRSLEIAKRENLNSDKMCLYGTGEYWTGFEQSAYFLSRIFPGLDSFVVNHPGHPFSIVGVSISDKKLKQYMKNHMASNQESDYLEFAVGTFHAKDFGRWHTKIVNDFKQAVGN